MAKAKRGLGIGITHSEPFGTGNSEPFGNSDSGMPEIARTLTGRPPVLTDAELLDLARSLNTRYGRPPKTEELIDEAGGCQRKRALSAIQGLRAELAQRAVRSQLLFPPAIEAQLRGLMADWLMLSADHLTQRQAEHSAQVDEQIEAAQAHVEELQVSIHDLRKVADALQQQVRQQNEQIRILGSERDQLRTERDALRAVAAERQRLIDKLVLGVGTAASERMGEAV